MERIFFVTWKKLLVEEKTYPFFWQEIFLVEEIIFFTWTTLLVEEKKIPFFCGNNDKEVLKKKLPGKKKRWKF